VEMAVLAAVVAALAEITLALFSQLLLDTVAAAAEEAVQAVRVTGVAAAALETAITAAIPVEL
jgi:hypothetical protein